MRALIVEKAGDGTTTAAVQEIDEGLLPEGEVVVRVEYSTLNYKDGLCIGPGGGLVRTYPHVPGIDFAGTVEASEDPRYAPGDKVVLTGWRVGEIHWGGYAQKARVKADWLVKQRYRDQPERQRRMSQHTEQRIGGKSPARQGQNRQPHQECHRHDAREDWKFECQRKGHAEDRRMRRRIADIGHAPPDDETTQRGRRDRRSDTGKRGADHEIVQHQMAWSS